MAPSSDKPSDPAHPSQGNDDHTLKDGTKPTSALSALTDETFLPTLDETSKTQQAKSHSLLLFLVVGGVVGAWFYGFEILQISPHKSWLELAIGLGGVSAVLLGLLYWTGTGNIDMWSLVMEWGWWSLPVAGAAGLLFVMMQERTEGIASVD